MLSPSLKGGDAPLQLETTYCIANIALWEDEKKNNSVVAPITSAYLITLLGSGNSSLQEACCWGMYWKFFKIRGLIRYT